MTPAPWVWITGQSRSGTSLTAGLLSVHGVWFGRCKFADWYNPLGYFEHLEIVRRVGAGDMSRWPEAWPEVMAREDYTGGPWAIKRGPRAWPWIRPLGPSAIVTTVRPVSQILASRRRIWPEKRNQLQIMEGVQAKVDRAAAEAGVPVFRVQTDALVRRDYETVLPVFDLLGVPFSMETADKWVDPSIWNRGRP